MPICQTLAPHYDRTPSKIKERVLGHVPIRGVPKWDAMWKAFAELGEIGWIGEKRPRMVAVQAAGYAAL